MTAPIRCESVDELLMTMTAICYALCQLYGSSIPDWEKVCFQRGDQNSDEKADLEITSDMTEQRNIADGSNDENE